MAAFVLTEPSIVINSVDLSDHVSQVTITENADVVESTSADGTGARSSLGGLKSGSISITFNQDFAASETNATLFPLIGTPTTVVVMPTQSAIGSTNPSYSGSYIVSEYPILDGAIGDLATSSVTWTRTGALTEATS